MKKNESIEVTIEAPCGIGSQTGKSEEIEILSRITNRFRGTQSYLASLFTGSLLEYFEGTVKDDFTPDIMADYRCEIENRRKAEAALSSANTSNHILTQDIEKLREQARCELEYRNKKIDEYQKVIDDLRMRLAEKSNAHQCANQENIRLSEHVRDLKVKLFDIMNK
jgi:hypothetical protein